MPYRAYLDRLSTSSYLDRVREGLAYIDAGRLIHRDTRVFIKPNLTFPEFRPGVMTSPEALEATIIALKDYTSHVTIGDADSGGYNPFSMQAVYKATGIIEFAERHGVAIVNLSDGRRTPIAFESRGRHLSVDLPDLLLTGTDLLVTMPVPKIHMNTGVSLSFKNQWGCIPEPKDRLRLHPDFPATILAVNAAVHSRIAVVDGRYGLTRSGPMEGDATPLDWVMVTDDIGAAASLCCSLIGIDPARIRHLALARKRGLLPRVGEVTCNADLAEFRATPFHLNRKWTDYPGLIAFRSRTVAYLAYFSPLAGLLHKILYLFREPFYDYEQDKPG
jgi:uncharacterized protein (DUF362 family)